jgi:hypothetical protein
MDDLVISYHFVFPDEREETFTVRFDSETLTAKGDLPDPLPDWTGLDVHKCAHCPLNTDKHPACPLAARIVDVVTRFGEVLSYEEVEVTVETPERTVIKKRQLRMGSVH